MAVEWVAGCAWNQWPNDRGIRMNNEEEIVDYAQLIFKAATEAIARLRWFLLTTTLLAGLVVVNLYLGEFRAGVS